MKCVMNNICVCKYNHVQHTWALITDEIIICTVIASTFFLKWL